MEWDIQIIQATQFRHRVNALIRHNAITSGFKKECKSWLWAILLEGFFRSQSKKVRREPGDGWVRALTSLSLSRELTSCMALVAAAGWLADSSSNWNWICFLVGDALTSCWDASSLCGLFEDAEACTVVAEAAPVFPVVVKCLETTSLTSEPMGAFLRRATTSDWVIPSTHTEFTSSKRSPGFSVPSSIAAPGGKRWFLFCCTFVVDKKHSLKMDSNSMWSWNEEWCKKELFINLYTVPAYKLVYP